jgi:hypothetical protein
MDLSAGINFAVDNAQLVFPPNSTAPDSNAFSIGDTRTCLESSRNREYFVDILAALSLSATPGVQATGTLTAHLIPSLNLGVSVLGGKGEANIFLALDTSAALVLNLDASATITQPVGDNSTHIRKNLPGKILQFFENFLLAAKILILFAILAKFPEV